MHAHLRQGSHVAYSVRMTTNLANVPEGTRVRNAHASEVMGTVIHAPGGTVVRIDGQWHSISHTLSDWRVSHTDPTRPVDQPTDHAARYARHAAQAPTWNDPWSGNPDTDRYWAHNND